MLRRVAPVRTNISEELGASFISVTRIGELGATLTVTSNRRASVASYSGLYGPQSRSGRYGEAIFFSPTGTRTLIPRSPSQPVAWNYTNCTTAALNQKCNPVRVTFYSERVC
jgi:hypothetical protein